MVSAWSRARRRAGPAALLALALSALTAGPGTALGSAAAAPGPLPGPPAVAAPAAAVLDAATGRVLYAKAATERRPIASTTKIMTALVALEAADLDDPVTVPAEATRVQGSRIFLEAGETYRLEDLLVALMVSSANDAAVAVAVHVAGSVEAFVRQMNATAAGLGLDDTAFQNPHGLDADGHYSTALDLARLGAHAMQRPAFRRLVGLVEATIPYPALGGTRTLRTHNYLLTGYPGATGIKTGWTQRSGYSIVGSAMRDGREVVAVILGASARTQWRDISRLLDFGLAAAPALDTRIPPAEAAAARHGLAPSGPQSPRFLGWAAGPAALLLMAAAAYLGSRPRGRPRRPGTRGRRVRIRRRPGTRSRVRRPDDRPDGVVQLWRRGGGGC